MKNKDSWEKLFDANWEEYLTDAISFYVASEGWETISPKAFAKADYKKLKNHIRHIIQTT